MLTRFPSDCKWVAYGLDFGYSNAFTALPKVGIRGDDLYVDLLLYERGLVNVPVKDNEGNVAPNIHDEMEKLGLTTNDEIYADSAEAKSIMELQLMGWNVYPVKKGDGSIPMTICFSMWYYLYP